MKVSRKLQTLLLSITVIFLITGGAASFFLFVQPAGLNKRLAAEALPTLDAIGKAEDAVTNYVGGLQGALVTAAGLPNPGLYDKPDNNKLNIETVKRLEEAVKFGGIDEAQLGELRKSIQALADAGDELRRLVSEAAFEKDYRDQAATYFKGPVSKARNDVLAKLDLLAEPNLAAIADLSEKVWLSQMIGLGCLVLGLIGMGLVVFMAIGHIRREINLPLADILKRGGARQLVLAPDNEWGQVAGIMNRAHQEIHEIQNVMDQFAGGALEISTNESLLTERSILGLIGTKKRIQLLNAEFQARDRDLKTVKQNLAAKETELAQTQNRLSLRIAGLEKGLLVAEADTDFNLLAANPEFATWFDANGTPLEGQTLSLSLPTSTDTLTRVAITDTVSEGRPWTGLVQARTAKQEPRWLELAVAASSGRLIIKALDVTDLKTKEASLEHSIAEMHTHIQFVEQHVEELNVEQAILRKSYESQKQLEYRLVQQQSALQELTRNSDLKVGNVREALRTITETTVYALDDERVGLWLLTNNGANLRCLDLYERQRMLHLDGAELQAEQARGLFEAILDDRIIAAHDAATDERTAEIRDNYLVPNGVSSLLAAPIRLGGDIVGAITAEHTGPAKHWTLDEQNFLMSVADIVSLALEQGNRRAMEEELRMTLEESQALEEELRQNAEEIEATNEEMRRTQIELRGQINALNNAAIVSETNLQGLITYANNEFCRNYEYQKKEVLGQTHRILRTDTKPKEFWAAMWQTILGGKVWRGEVCNRTKSGQLIWVAATITPVIGVDGKVYKFISVGFDISAQKRQEEQIQAALDIALQQEELLRENTRALQTTNEEIRRTQVELAGQLSALNNSSLVYETNMKGEITFVNDELLRVSGFQRQDLIGKHFSALKSGRQPEAYYQKQWQTIQKGSIWRGEMELVRADGERFWVLETNTPVLDQNEEPMKTINVLFDITEQKTQEFRLKKQQSALLKLNSDPVLKDGRLDEAFSVIVRVGLETIDVDRASIWLFEEGTDRVKCVKVYEKGKHFYEEGAVLDRSMYPLYFRTLERDMLIAANDAANDPRTSELAFTVLKPFGTTSVLDATIRLAGNPVGLISFEHKGSVRDWSLDEQGFVASLADTTGLLLEQKERQLNERLKEAYAQLEEASRELVRQKEEIEESSRTLTESMRYAKRIQQNILPDKHLLGTYLPNYFIVYRPRDIVGGDFYWFTALDELNVLVVADGTGHGAPGAFLTLIGYLLLNQIVNEKKITEPAQILYHLHIGVRTALKQDAEESTSRDGMDVAIFVYNRNTYEAQYAGANLPIYYYQDWEIHEIKPDKKSIGGEQMEEERIFKNHRFQLKPGDAVYMYTDGFVDQMGGPDEKRFSTRRFRDLILRTQHESMATQRALLNLEWKEWKEDREQLDDVTVFGIKL